MDEPRLKEAAGQSPAASPHLFEARGVNAAVPAPGGGTTTIFSDLSFHIDAGQIVDLTGASGAGKSTLLKAFARLDVNTDGTFLLRGKDSSQFTPQQWRVHVSYLPQAATLIGETVADAIRLPFTLKVRMRETGESARELLPDDRIREFLDSVGCADIDLARNPADLSGGQAARVSLARTLLTKPDVMLADEVDAGLDAANADKVGEILTQAAANGMAIVRVRHRATDHRAARTMILLDGHLETQQEAGHAAAAAYGDAAPTS